MRQPRRRIQAGAMAAVMVLAAALAGMNWTRAAAQNDPASRALSYLQTKELASGEIPAGGSFEPTEQFVIGAAANGYDPTALKLSGGQSPLDYLAANVTDATATAGKTGELIEAVVAAGDDPTNFGTPKTNLLSVLAGDYDTTTGKYGAGDAFTQSLALLGLRAAKHTVPPLAEQWLLTLRDSDGGFEDQAGWGSDTNSTAMAIMALGPAMDATVRDQAVAWLQLQQDDDGGFPYQSGSGSDVNSTGLVLQALLAAGQSPQSCAWMRDNNTPYSYLVAQQANNGGFQGYSGGEDPFTTAPLVAALGFQPYPVVPAYLSGASLAQSSAAAHAALMFLQSNQSALLGSVYTSVPSYAPTEEYIVGAAAAGYDATTLTNGGGPSAVDYLSKNADAASSNAADTGELLLAVAAARQNPHSFGGVDLIQRLFSQYQTTSGKFGNGETFTQTLAMLGLAANGVPVPEAASAYLLQDENSDGGWSDLGTKDPGNSDTNSTSMALMALAASGYHGADKAALAWLATQQNADGGFPYQAIPGASSDADSDALVQQALLATFQNPASWSRGGNTVVSNLLSLQSADGRFHNGSTDDTITTAPVVAALERVALPVNAMNVQSGNTLSGPAPSPVAVNAVPVLQCSTPGGVLSTTPTPTSTTPPSTPKPKPTAKPTPAPTPTSTPATPSPSPQVVTPLTGGPPPAATAAQPRPAPGGPPQWLLYLGIAALAAILTPAVVLARTRWN